jgi:hypothetical protein
VRPRQNSHLWCEFWLIDVNIVELLHSPEVRGGESLEIWSLLRSHSDNSRTARWPQPPSATCSTGARQPPNGCQSTQS